VRDVVTHLLDDILKGWRWAGVEPAAVLDVNAFGNVVFRSQDGACWRICPEELSCEIIAPSEDGYGELRQDPEFRADWLMASLVNEAEAELGRPPAGRCFCLKIPAVLGGSYSLDNIGTIAVGELLRFAGDMAEQIKDLPDGAQVSLKFVD